MKRFLINAMLHIYVYLFGIDFYMTGIKDDDIQDDNFNSELAVTYTQGSVISFKLYKKEVDYFFFRFGFMHKRKKEIYVVSANYGNVASVKLERYKNIRLYMRSSVLYMVNNESLIYEFLVNMYLESMIKELGIET